MSRLAKEVGLESGALKDVLELIKELDQILYGLSLLKEESPRLRARVCSFGERLSTQIAIQILKYHGLNSALISVFSPVITCFRNATDLDVRLGIFSLATRHLMHLRRTNFSMPV